MENNRLALQLNEQMLFVLTGNPKTNARMRDQVYLHVIIVICTPYLDLCFGAQMIHEVNEHDPQFTNTPTGKWTHSGKVWLGFLWHNIRKVSLHGKKRITIQSRSLSML